MATRGWTNNAGVTCQIDGCEEVSRTRQMCRTHYQRWWRYGDPLVTSASEHGRRWTGDDATYAAVHLRLRAQQGSASEQSCIDCGRQADEWSYDHRDPNQKVSEKGQPYSIDPSHYQPRCRPCHRTLDADRTPGCEVEGCAGAHKAHGLCGKHYLRAWRAS